MVKEPEITMTTTNIISQVNQVLAREYATMLIKTMYMYTVNAKSGS